MLVGLYSRNGLHGHLDYSCDCPVDRDYPIWRPLSWLLAARYVSAYQYAGKLPSDLFSCSYGLNPNYGTADDLKDLASALHKRGMYLMVDVVANHMVSWLIIMDLNCY